MKAGTQVRNFEQLRQLSTNPAAEGRDFTKSGRTASTEGGGHANDQASDRSAS